jgi:adenylate kinase family enzyme
LQDKIITGRKIVIVGSSGCGKSTFAEKLAKKLNITHYEIDSLFWKPDWIQTEPEEFRHLVDDVTRQNEWIIDGNYRRIQDLTIGRAETVIWLDYSFMKTFYRVTARTAGRLINKKPLWHNNRESLKMTFSKDSIILYTITQFKNKKNWYNRLKASYESEKSSWVHIKNSREEQNFWKELQQKSPL